LKGLVVPKGAVFKAITTEEAKERAKRAEERLKRRLEEFGKAL